MGKGCSLGRAGAVALPPLVRHEVQEKVGPACAVPMDLYHDNVAMPMDLHHKVLRMVPAKKDLLVPDPTLPGKMMLTCKEDFDALPEFSWWEIFTIMGVAVPEGVKRH